jgi:hypothetical protein
MAIVLSFLSVKRKQIPAYAGMTNNEMYYESVVL